MGCPPTRIATRAFTEALKNYPDIKVVASVFTGWSPDKAAQQMKELAGLGQDRSTESGPREPTRTWSTPTRPANLKYVPVVGADNNGFMGQEIEMKDAGVVGINVTNPPAVGGAGLVGRAGHPCGEEPSAA